MLRLAPLAAAISLVACSKPFVSSDTAIDCADEDGDFYCAGEGEGADCDDSDPATNPAGEEIWYDGQDQDCDGNDDDQDLDGSAYGADCDDLDPSVKPGAAEVWYDGTDQDCDEWSDFDADHDGYDSAAQGAGTDCDDTDPMIHPGADDEPYDGVDANCDGGAEYDADGDGHDPLKHGGGDCDDSDPDINPDAFEVWYDGVDQDCDGASDYDADGDGYDADLYGGEDCNDQLPGVNPDAEETWYDGEDRDCDGGDDYDADGDTHRSADYGGDDCDDTDADAYPGAAEIWYDGVDGDCLGGDDYDADGDGDPYEAFGGTDCNDTNAAIYGGAPETWYDGVDSDCDGANDYDADGDSYESDDYGGDDCDDTDASAHPGAAEVWYDGVDGDCEGGNDYDRDGDGYEYGDDDCDDSDAAVNPDAIEVLGDSDDSDCDGDADSAPFQELLAYSCTDLRGPRLAENDSGVIVGVMSGSAYGTSNPGSLWHFLDPTAPWDGSIDYYGWYYSSASSPEPDRTYDMVADGSYILEAFEESGSVGAQITVTTTLLGAAGGTTSTPLYTGDASLTFSDVHMSTDGTDVAVVFCEERSSSEWVIYMTGTPAEFYNDTSWGYGYRAGGGGNVCASRVSQNDMLVGSDENNTVVDYTYVSGSTSLTTTSTSTSTEWVGLDYALDGADVLKAYITSAGTLTVDDSGTTSNISVSGTLEVMRAAWDGTTAYVVYVNTSGDLYLYYGRPGSTLYSVPLDPGFSTVLDADVIVSSGNTLVVAARGSSGDFGFMALDL
jgi:hypothetical protein